MFSSTYQNGEYGVEIFSPSGNDPFKACKLNNESNIKKLYDRSIKGYMLALEKESASTSLQFPKSMKGSLGITQPLLVLQLQLHPEKAFSLEMIVVDTDRQRRRFHFSTNFKDIDVNSLHVCIPWIQPDRDQWTNVAINLEELLSRCSAGKSFGSLESFTVQPVCRIRKIFSLPLKYLGDEMTGLMIPPKHDFTSGVEASSWIFSFLDASNPQKGANLAPANTQNAGQQKGENPSDATMGLGLGIVGKKVARREVPVVAPGTTVAPMVEEAAMKRMKSTVAEIPTSRPQQRQVHEPASAPIVFSGRLKKKLSSAHPAAPLSARSEKDVPSSPVAQGESSMQDDHSTVADGHSVGGNTSAIDSSGPVEDSNQLDTSLSDRPPSADASINMSVLTETEAGSAVNLTTGAVLMPPYSERSHSPLDPDDDDRVLERYLQLRQSRKMMEGVTAAAPPLAPGRSQSVPQSRFPPAAVLASIDSGTEGGGVLQQSVHDYSLIEEYVNAYKLHNKLPAVRESVFIAEEKEQLGDLLPSSVPLISDAQLESRPMSARSPEQPVSAAVGADGPSTPQQDPQLAYATFVSSRVKTFVDAAVSPMPAPRTHTHPRFSAAEADLAPITEGVAAGEGIATATGEEEEGQKLGNVGTSPRQSYGGTLIAQRSTTTPSEAYKDFWPSETISAPLARPSTSRPVSSNTTATPPRQSRPATAPGASSLDMEQQLLSPFSEAVAFIENFKEPSAPGPPSVVNRTSASLHQLHSAVSRENVEPNAHAVVEKDTVVQEDGEYASYKRRSEASAEAYTTSVERLLTKLEQRVSTDAEVSARCRPGSALVEGSTRRSSNSATLLSATGTPRKAERRKKAIRERVAGLLRQVAHAEMEYIAEFGFDAFEKEVGFFEENLPWLQRTGQHSIIEGRKG